MGAPTDVPHPSLDQTDDESQNWIFYAGRLWTPVPSKRLTGVTKNSRDFAENQISGI
jgi:hypothetical protein